MDEPVEPARRKRPTYKKAGHKEVTTRMPEALAKAVREAAAGKAAAVVLSQVRVGTRGLAAAAQALATEQQHLAETLYPQREAIAACFGRRPTGVLAEAGRDLLDEIEKASER